MESEKLPFLANGEEQYDLDCYECHDCHHRDQRPTKPFRRYRFWFYSFVIHLFFLATTVGLTIVFFERPFRSHEGCAAQRPEQRSLYCESFQSSTF